MGCCSSTKSLTASKSPTSNISVPNEETYQNENVIQQNTERVNPQQLKQLQQHHNINQGQGSPSTEDELPRSFANNQSIVREVMELRHPNETKSDENSEDTQIINESFSEFPVRSRNVMDTNCTNDIEINNNVELEDSYHPFGFIQTENQEKEKCINVHVHNIQHENQENERVTVIANLEELYAENLKEHGFDVNKFRIANTSIAEQFDSNQKSTDLSSFASSSISSKSNVNKTNINSDYMENINNFITEEDEEDDLIQEELSRSFMSENVISTNDQCSFIQNFKQSVETTHEINNIMDDQDEELMDAILSLDFAN